MMPHPERAMGNGHNSADGRTLLSSILRESPDEHDAEMSFADAEAMGLSHDEWLLILKRLDRTPNLCELGIFSAMWSEHCSYKSSKNG